MPQFDASQQSANVEITVNPLVNWVWLGFGLLAFGTFIALLPEAAFTFAVGRVPESAKTATASLLLLAIVLPAAVQAQDGTAGPAREQDDDAARCRGANHLHVRLGRMRPQSAQ